MFIMDPLNTLEAEPPIFDLLLRSDWEGALALLNLPKVQQEAAIWTQRSSRETLVHIALYGKNPPLEVVQRLVSLNPSCLLDRQDPPLRRACRNASWEVIQYLLEVDPSMTYSQDCLDDAPLRIMLFRDMKLSINRSRKSIVEIFQMLLKARYPQFNQTETFLVLHAAVTWINEVYLREPYAIHLMNVLFSVVPSSELMTLDQCGNTPLHLACRGDKQDEGHFKYHNKYNDFPEIPKKCLFALLVRAHPSCASVLYGDEAPLHMVLKQKRYLVGLDEMAVLVNAHPNALTTIDPVLGLFPFQLAACCENTSISTIYYLLRECPEFNQLFLSYK